MWWDERGEEEDSVMKIRIGSEVAGTEQDDAE